MAHRNEKEETEQQIEGEQDQQPHDDRRRALQRSPHSDGTERVGERSTGFPISDKSGERDVVRATGLSNRQRMEVVVRNMNWDNYSRVSTEPKKNDTYS